MVDRVNIFLISSLLFLTLCVRMEVIKKFGMLGTSPLGCRMWLTYFFPIRVTVPNLVALGHMGVCRGS